MTQQAHALHVRPDFEGDGANDEGIAAGGEGVAEGSGALVADGSGVLVGPAMSTVQLASITASGSMPASGTADRDTGTGTGTTDNGLDGEVRANWISAFSQFGMESVGGDHDTAASFFAGSLETSAEAAGVTTGTHGTNTDTQSDLI